MKWIILIIWIAVTAKMAHFVVRWGTWLAILPFLTAHALRDGGEIGGYAYLESNLQLMNNRLQELTGTKKVRRMVVCTQGAFACATCALSCLMLSVFREWHILALGMARVHYLWFVGKIRQSAYDAVAERQRPFGTL